MALRPLLRVLGCLLAVACGTPPGSASGGGAGGSAGGVGAGSGGGSAAAGGGGSPGPSTWRQHSSTWPGTVRAAWGSSPTDVWAVGELGLLAHFDGDKWTVATSPVRALFTAVWGSGPDDVWAAGMYAVVHYDGSAWTAVGPAQTALLTFTCIWGSGPKDVWFGTERGDTYRFDGTTWTEAHHSPGRVAAIGGTSAADVWVVSPGSPPARWNGTRWSALWPAPDDAIAALHAIASNDIWMGGKEIHHWNGTQWLKPSLSRPAGSRVTRIWASGPSDVWFVEADAAGSRVFHFDGVTYRDTSVHAGPVPIHTILGFSPGDPWIFTWADLLRKDGAGWANHGLREDLHAVWAQSATQGWIAGARGVLLQWDGARLRPRASGTPEHLYALWGSGPDDVWAGGAKGTLLHKDSSGWTLQAAVTSEDLKFIWGSGPNDVWAGGEVGPFLHYDGTRWSSTPRPSAAPFTRIWGASSSDVWVMASGWGNGVWRWNGAAWNEVSFSVPNVIENTALYSLWGSGPNDVWLLGIDNDWQASVFHWDGAQWGSPHVFAGVKEFAGRKSIWASGPNDVWAAIADGELRHFDGTSWSEPAPGPLPSGHYVHAFGGPGAAQVWAVGSRGLVLHLGP